MPRHSLETPTGIDISRLNQSIQHVMRASPDVQPSKALRLGIGFAGRHIGLMWQQRSGKEARRYAVELSTNMHIALDILDSAVDAIPDIDKRLGVYDTATEHAINGRCDCRKNACLPIYQMGLVVNETLIRPSSPLADTLRVITSVGREQMTSQSEDTQERCMRQMGESCMLLLLQASEIAHEQRAPSALHGAIGQLGIAVYMQDLAYEVKDDLAAANLTYVTLRIQNGEDTDAVVREVTTRATAEKNAGLLLLADWPLPPRGRYELLWRAMSFKNHYL